MLKVLSIQNKDEQQKICRLCDVEYDPDTLAYLALDDDRLAGICQFAIKSGYGVIYDLRPAHDFGFNLPVLMTTGRAALNFMDLCGTPTVYFRPRTRDNDTPVLASAVGFETDADGLMSVSLAGFFDHPCTGGCAE